MSVCKSLTDRLLAQAGRSNLVDSSTHRQVDRIESIRRPSWDSTQFDSSRFVDTQTGRPNRVDSSTLFRFDSVQVYWKWMAQIPLTKEIIKGINSVIFKFVWRGRDKVKHLSLVSDYRDGGLRMPHIESLTVLKRKESCA